MRKKLAYSYIEILISISIIAIIGVMVTPIMSSFYASNQLRLTEDAFVSMVRKAQAYAISNKNDVIWGVCLNGSYIRMYSGSCSSPITEEEYEIPGSLTVTGLSDMQFVKGKGELSSAQQIIMSSRTDSVTIDLTPVGGIVTN